MNIKITQFNDYQVVKLVGEVDLSNSREIKQEIIRLIKTPNHVAVDFTELTYIDSSGMASLVEAFNESRNHNTEFHIIGAQGSPLQVLKLTRLNTVFSLLESLEHLTPND